jgi:hypothetical protein
MNQQLKTVLLTVLTLSCFMIALVELSGVSSTAILNKYPSVYNKFQPGSASPETPARNKAVAEMPKTTIQFYETKYSFGQVNEGDIVKHVFRFKNTGNNPLMISKVDVSCGCTVPTFSKEPIAPGGEGQIQIQYNSTNHEGHQIKNVIVHSNAQQEAISISFDADVKSK